MKNNKERTSVSVYPDQQRSLTNDNFISNNKNKFSTAVGFGIETLKFLKKNIITKGLSGIFTFEEIKLIFNAIKRNESSILKRVLDEGLEVNNHSLELNSLMFKILHDFPEDTKNEKEIKLVIETSRKILELEEFETFVLVWYLFNIENLDTFTVEKIAMDLLSKEERKEIIEDTFEYSEMEFPEEFINQLGYVINENGEKDLVRLSDGEEVDGIIIRRKK